jgi:hypothetical protein
MVLWASMQAGGCLRIAKLSGANAPGCWQLSGGTAVGQLNISAHGCGALWGMLKHGISWAYHMCDTVHDCPVPDVQLSTLPAHTHVCLAVYRTVLHPTGSIATTAQL